MAGSIQEFAIKAEAIDLPTRRSATGASCGAASSAIGSPTSAFFSLSYCCLGHRRALSGALRARSSLLVGAYADPSAKHWLGTDELGRDTWVRIMHGGRVSLAVGLTVGISTVILGGLIGILAGYVGGVLDNALMRLVDTFTRSRASYCCWFFRNWPGPDCSTSLLFSSHWNGPMPRVWRVARCCPFASRSLFSPRNAWALRAGV